MFSKGKLLKFNKIYIIKAINERSDTIINLFLYISNKTYIVILIII